jgi:flavin-dependent dehydrogenase
MHDAIVVGAGPAGLLAARHLALRGLDVAVLEEHSAVGDPVHCTGILAREAFSEFGLSFDTVLNELTTARFISPPGTKSSTARASWRQWSSTARPSMRVCTRSDRGRGTSRSRCPRDRRVE